MSKASDEHMDIIQRTKLDKEGVMSGATSPHAQVIDAAKAKVGQKPAPFKLPADDNKQVKLKYDKTYPVDSQMGIVPLTQAPVNNQDY